MKLTTELKAAIDELPYEEMLRRWRFTPSGDPVFEGESAEYFGKRMAELRAQPGGNDRHVSASKSIGW